MNHYASKERVSYGSEHNSLTNAGQGIRSATLGIRTRPNPTVFVVEEETEVDRILWSLAGGPSEHEQIKVARESGIPVLDGNDVIRDLPEQMAPEAEEILREEISHIQAAREDKVAVFDSHCPIGYRIVPIEELTGPQRT